MSLLEPIAGLFPPKITQNLSTVIAASASVSSIVDLGGASLVGIIFPATMTGSSITFNASNDGVNFYEMYSTVGGALSVIFTASAWVGIVPSDFAGVKYLQLVSNGTESSSRQITLIARILE